MIAPIINMQLMLRESLIGKSFWMRLERKRKEREQHNFLKRLNMIKTEVKNIQMQQRLRIGMRHRREKEDAIKHRKNKENAHREENLRLRHKVASGARRAHSSFVQLMHSKKEGGKKKFRPKQVEIEFTDLGMLCVMYVILISYKCYHCECYWLNATCIN